MKYSVFANIGNRNIIYKSQENEYFYDELKRLNDFKGKSSMASFFKFTEYLIQNFAQEKDNIYPNILSKLLEKKHSEIDHVYIFSTLQDPVFDSDTFHEAEILKLIFEEQYKDINFQTVQIKIENKNVSILIDPTNNNDLLRFYRGFLKGYQKENPDKPILIMDAGGTAQQKSSFKIMMEFIYDEEQFKVYYGRKIGNSTQLESTEQIEYRKIIQSLQILKLINHYQFYAALLELKVEQRKNSSPEEKSIIKILQALDKRWGLENKPNNEINDKTCPSILKPYIQPILDSYILSAQLLNSWSELIHPNQILRLKEILLKTNIYIKLQNSSEAILSFQQFQELFLAATITKTLNYNLIKHFQFEDSKMIEAANTGNLAFEKSYFKEKKLSPGIPSKVAILEKLSNEKINKVVACIKKTHSFFNPKVSYSLDRARNKIAHEGKKVTWPFFIKEYQYVIEEVELLNSLFEIEIEKYNPYEIYFKAIEEMI